MARAQSSNAAFAKRPTRQFRECIEDPAGSYEVYCNTHAPLAGVPHFTDAKGWYPGLELRGEDLFFRDIDAAVVVPSKDRSRTSRSASSSRSAGSPAATAGR